MNVISPGSGREFLLSLEIQALNLQTQLIGPSRSVTSTVSRPVTELSNLNVRVNRPRRVPNLKRGCQWCLRPGPTCTFALYSVTTGNEELSVVQLLVAVANSESLLCPAVHIHLNTRARADTDSVIRHTVRNCDAAFNPGSASFRMALFSG